MSFFGKILDKLGIGGRPKGEAGATAEAPSASATTSTPAMPPAAGTPPTAVGGIAAAPAGAAATPAVPQPAAQAQPPAQPAVQAVSQVDVAAQLEQKAAAHPQKLNWRTSIVDLLKLLDIDSSLQARKELATELGCPAELMSDSARMNMWLHKAVMQKLAANGGKVPADLLD